jgi:hypothetical protein
MASFGFIIAVSGATLIANIESRRWKAATLLGSDSRRQLGFVDSIGASLVIDKAAWPELRNGDEARALQVGTL